jgi:hypothetical protein
MLQNFHAKRLGADNSVFASERIETGSNVLDKSKLLMILPVYKYPLMNPVMPYVLHQIPTQLRKSDLYLVDNLYDSELLAEDPEGLLTN